MVGSARTQIVLRRRFAGFVAVLLLSMMCLLWMSNQVLRSSETIGPFHAATSYFKSSNSMRSSNATTKLVTGMVTTGWVSVLAHLRATRQRYVIINAKNGLGNRLRAVASAMSVAEYLRRPVLVIWVPDLHCNCSFTRIFAQPLPFALLQEEIPMQHISASLFQVFNYMRPEPGAAKGELVDPDPERHLYFKSGFVMNHEMGAWRSGGPQRQLRRLQPVKEVRAAGRCSQPLTFTIPITQETRARASSLRPHPSSISSIKSPLPPSGPLATGL